MSTLLGGAAAPQRLMKLGKHKNHIPKIEKYIYNFSQTSHEIRNENFHDSVIPVRLLLVLWPESSLRTGQCGHEEQQ